MTNKLTDLEKKALKMFPKFEDTKAEYFRDKKFALKRLNSEVNEFNKTGDLTYLISVIHDIIEYSNISITDIQKNTGLNRSTIYSIINKENTPKADTLFLVLKELGYKFCIKPINDGANKKAVTC